MSHAPRKRGALLAGCLSVVLFARAAGAQDVFPPAPVPDPALTPPAAVVDPFPSPSTLSPDPTVVAREHLVIKNQYFDGSVAGLRSYLETIKTTNPQLYAQLAPDADRLASRRTTAAALFAGGLAAGVVAILAGVFTGSECAMPAASDPNFAADAAAWNSCNRDNSDRIIAFGAIGVLLAAGGLAGAVAAMPTHQDLLDVVNKHNRLSPDPMRLQIGYDASQHLASAGATISF